MAITRKSVGSFVMLTRMLALTLLYVEVVPTSSTLLPNLRRFRIKGTSGRFLGPRDSLQAVINKRTEDDQQCGKHVDLSLAQSLKSAQYDESLYGEVYVNYGTFEDMDLDYLPCDLRSQLQTTYRNLLVAIPYQSNGQPGLLVLAEVTDARNRLPSPSRTNDKLRLTGATFQEDDDRVTISIQRNTMTMRVSPNVTVRQTRNSMQTLMQSQVQILQVPVTLKDSIGVVVHSWIGIQGTVRSFKKIFAKFNDLTVMFVFTKP
ncbi:hypothetical protein BSL78_22329 [Apostichopus japonicus]|uniref:Uncharacterized protein n=1 Tax=Stichopus japonicus TaxID=307972 RepID=A0A2G8JYK0_STIJA|nr:hypothetical protein BSL78_22329 [Apostichopus japonicus]